MGQVPIFHRFNHYDAVTGVHELVLKAREEFGDREGYSGAINSITNFFIHVPTQPVNTEKRLRDYIAYRMDNCIEKYDGEIIELGITDYAIATPVIREYKGRPPFDLDVVRRHADAPSLLFSDMGILLTRGFLIDIKGEAKRFVMQNKFLHDVFIVIPKTLEVLIVTGQARMVKHTTKKSDFKTLILPHHDYVVYGWGSQ